MKTNWPRVVIVWGIMTIGTAVIIEHFTTDDADFNPKKIMAERIVKIPYEQSP